MSENNFALVGASLSNKCISSLRTLGYEVIVLPPYDRLGVETRTHTDMFIFILGKIILTFGDYTLPESAAGKLSQAGFDIIRASELPENVYPKDVLLNALTVGEFIFAKLDSMSSDIKDIAEGYGYELINVKQGYARCSACPLSGEAIITADPSIAKAAEGVGIDVLRISSGGVSLAGFDYGFIGGACGVDGNRLYFAGDISLHPNGKEIAEFCQRHGKTAVSLSDEPLYDVGSIFFIH